MSRRPEKVGKWEKMPLWEKLISASIIILPLSCCGSQFVFTHIQRAFEAVESDRAAESKMLLWDPIIMEGGIKTLVNLCEHSRKGGPFADWPRSWKENWEAFYRLVKSLQTEESRTDLMDRFLTDSLRERKLNAGIDQAKDLQRVNEWAREHGCADNMDLLHLREYFQEELNWSDEDWQLFEGYYHRGKATDLSAGVRMLGQVPIQPIFLWPILFLLFLMMGCGLVWRSHYGARPTPAPKLEKEGKFLLSSRAEYLGGHPLLSEIQVVRLGLTEEEVAIAAEAGTATIPVRDISDVIVGSERSPSMVATLGTTTVSLLTRRILLPGVSKTENYLVVQYQDETGMRNNVIFGYIAPPHSHEEWRNKIVSTRYKAMTGKTLEG